MTRKPTDAALVYANPLPIVLVPGPAPSPLWAALRTVLASVGLVSPPPAPVVVERPHCTGLLDIASRSVWITHQDDIALLWQRGFFGKGALSRSEPTWFTRQTHGRAGPGPGPGSSPAAAPEEITARRRAARRRFKQDRARAIVAAKAEAEAAFAEDGRVTQPSTSAIPSAATWRPAPEHESTYEGDERDDDVDDANEDDANDANEAVPPSIQDIEHLQLTLQEAFFLVWTLDSLAVVHPESRQTLSLEQVWQAFQDVYTVHARRPCVDDDAHRLDNPFVVHYVVYHHFRALGWVTRSGTKFGADLLLYRRGPVFAHAEFAVVVCPVYEDDADRASSPFTLHNVDPFSWSWLSTLNRVNAQVQKTLILAYITIPARSRVPDHALSSPTCLSYYSVREVVVRRFVPARMRD